MNLAQGGAVMQPSTPAAGLHAARGVGRPLSGETPAIESEKQALGASQHIDKGGEEERRLMRLLVGGRTCGGAGCTAGPAPSGSWKAPDLMRQRRARASAPAPA